MDGSIKVLQNAGKGDLIMRYTKEIIQKILESNNGYKAETSYTSRNLRYTNNYEIKDGKLYCNSQGKTSWADSHFDDYCECDIEQTRRFLKRNGLGLSE